jgi:hypothetical protein
MSSGRFADIMEVSKDNTEISSMMDKIDQAHNSPAGAATALHIVYSTRVNYTVSAFESKIGKLPKRKEDDPILADHCSLMVEFWDKLEIKFAALTSETAVYCNEMSRQWSQKLREYKYVPIELSEAPPLPSSPPSEMSIDDINERAGEWVLARKAKKPKKVKKRAEPNFVVKPPITVDFDHEADETKEEVSAGGAAFPASQKRVLFLIYSPARKSPHVDGKRIKMSEISKHGTDAIEWIESSPEQYFPTVPLSLAFLQVVRSDNLISGSVFEQLARKANEDFKSVTPLTRVEALEKYPESALWTAQTEWCRAQAAMLLEKGALGYKSKFTDVWFERLTDVPMDVDYSKTAFTFLHYIKKALKSRDPRKEINRTFYAFKMANLVNWKAGETRTAMLQRCEKSLKAYWGENDDKYVQAFLASPAGQYEVRPKYGAIAVKMANAQKELTRQARLAAKTVKESYGPTLAALAEEVKEEAELQSELTSSLSWFQAARFRMVRAFKWVSSVEHGPIRVIRVKHNRASALNLRQKAELLVTHIKKSRSAFVNLFIRTRFTHSTEEDGTDVLTAIDVDRVWWSWAKAPFKFVRHVAAKTIRWTGYHFNHYTAESAEWEFDDT